MVEAWWLYVAAAGGVAIGMFLSAILTISARPNGEDVDESIDLSPTESHGAPP